MQLWDNMSLWEKTVRVFMFYYLIGFDISMVTTVIGCIIYTVKYVKRRQKRYIPFIWLSILYVVPRFALVICALIFTYMFVCLKLGI